MRCDFFNSAAVTFYLDTGGDLGFDGYYGYVSWLLTGESRNYRRDRDVFDILLAQALQPQERRLRNLGACCALQRPRPR